jgi:nitric oxide reductase large subunit
MGNLGYYRAATGYPGFVAMFGVFGMLALGVVFFCLRAIRGDAIWNRAERSASTLGGLPTPERFTAREP